MSPVKWFVTLAVLIFGSKANGNYYFFIIYLNALDPGG